MVWVELLSRGGHEQCGRRPAIVFQTADASATLPTVLIVPLTTQLDALRFPRTVFIEPHSSTGLRQRSVALVFQMTAVDARLVNDAIGAVAAETLEAIWRELEALAGRTMEDTTSVADIE